MLASMKLHPRLILASARSIFRRSSPSFQYPYNPPAGLHGAPASARDADTLIDANILTTQHPSLFRAILLWLAAAGLTAAYVGWLFADFLQNAVR